jgi:hypothetical protein
MTAWIVEPGSSGNNVSAPHKSALDGVATSVLIVAYVALNDWTPATAAVIFSVYGSTVGDGMIRATIDTSGHMAINVVSTATGVLQTGSTTTVLQTAAGIADGDGIWLFWTYRASTGSCDFRYSLDPPTTAPTAVTWTALQTARSSGTSGQLQTSTAPMQVGGFSTSGGSQPLAGKVYRALLYKASTTGQITTAAGQTLLADCDPNQWTSGTTFVSGGDTWTLNGTASIASDSTPKNDSDSGCRHGHRRQGQRDNHRIGGRHRQQRDGRRDELGHRFWCRHRCRHSPFHPHRNRYWFWYGGHPEDLVAKFGLRFGQ